MIDSQEIDSIKNQLIEKYRPLRIILFGSQAKETAGRKSDIDLCIVKETENKRALAVGVGRQTEGDRNCKIK
ncbi:nucleotidyltransferase domain-containing protein [Syntrophomonas wolfei]|uniref:nucleotidyltransferase domain-containing protein n=2 Tax=Syntrophomonas wolfei TaxID=863 RepID=UPI0023F07EC3|nr:nucleotidyltransferase domain-containing protein [Syntrophomonas wolfei]